MSLLSSLAATVTVVTSLMPLSVRAQDAPMPETISYTLSFPAPQTHYFEVEALIPTGGLPQVELMMAVWTPGSYLIREYARHLEALTARTEGDEPLAIRKTQKNRWEVETRGAPRVVVGYRVYARELSVRTNFVDSKLALLNGAATFLTLAGDGRRPHEVRVLPYPGWKAVVSALPELPAGEGPERRFRAEDFEALADAPLYAGNARIHSFEAAGKPHLLVNEGEEEGGIWNGPLSAADAERIVREEVAFWGGAPYPRYVFFNIITGSGAGGLEHRDASVLMANRWNARGRDGWLDWLSLVTHEHFHAWNGKRLRPLALGPFDYEREAYTRDLWVVEGITSYYDELLLHRARLSTRQEYLDRLSKQIETQQTTPGRLVQSMDESSFDAWIKLYRRDENFPNSGVSYYTKGGVVAFLLDARIRRASAGRRSLDDALRLAYARYSGERGYRTEEFHKILEEVAGTGLGAWLDHALATTRELDYDEALDWFGLRFKPQEARSDDKKPVPAWLGATTEVRTGRLVVTEVRRGTPALEAGLNVDDEILAIDDFRVPPEGLDKRLEAYRPGEKVSLLVARREHLLRLPVTFGEKPRATWKLEVDPKATAEQKARLEEWLRGTAEEEKVDESRAVVEEVAGR
jgi:predicted metalloprotease with PDZ domain